MGGSVSRLIAFLSVNFKENFKKLPIRNLEQVISWTYQTYNPGHNILELYNVLVQVRVATSKTKLDI